MDLLILLLEVLSPYYLKVLNEHIIESIIE